MKNLKDIIIERLHINKDTGKIMKNIIKIKEPFTDKEKIYKINIPIDNEGYELPIKFNNLEIKKDPNSNEEIIFNKETNLPINNIIRIKNPEKKKVFL